MHPGPPKSTSPDAPGPERRSCDAGPGGQLAETPDGRLCQATSCIVFAALRNRSQRAFIDEDVTSDMLGRRGVAGIQQRLPVQRDGIMPVDLLAAGRTYAGGTTNRTGLTQTRHLELRASRRRCSQQAPLATEVRSDYLTLPRVRPRPRASTDQGKSSPARRRTIVTRQRSGLGNPALADTPGTGPGPRAAQNTQAGMRKATPDRNQLDIRAERMPPGTGGGSAVRGWLVGGAVVREMAVGWPGPDGWGSRAGRSGRPC
jgi:hypothetical protein